MRPSTLALRIWRRNYESWKRYAFSFVVSALGGPIFYLVAIGYGVGRYVSDIGGVSYAAFLAPGLVATAAMNSASFEATFGSYTRMAEQETYTAILATPCSVADIVAADVLWAATKALAAVVFVLLVTTALGLIPAWWALALLPVGLLAGMTFGALGLVVTAVASSYNFFEYYFTLGISVMFVFSGVFYPVGSLPGWGQWLAWTLPLTHAVALSRALAAGWVGPVLLIHVAALAAFAVGGFVVAERLIRRRLLR